MDLQAERATLRLCLDAVVTDGVFRPAEFLIVIIAVADDGTVLIIDVVGKGVHHMIDHLRLTGHQMLGHDLAGYSFLRAGGKERRQRLASDRLFLRREHGDAARQQSRG